MVLDELKIIDSINLDCSNHNIRTINAKQTDTESRYVNVTCTVHGKKVILNHETVGALIVCKKPDNFYVLNRCTVSEEGTVLIELTQQMLAASGKAVAELILFSGVLDNNVDISGLLISDDGAGNVTIDGTNDVVQTLRHLGVSVLTTMSFYINILPSVITDSEIESSYEFNALVDGLSTQFAIEQQMKALENSITKAEESRVEAEKDRDTAEANRDAAETNRERAETARENAENEREIAFNAVITSAETATENANGAYESADAAAKDATAKISEMQTLMNTFNQAVSGVIQDDESSDMTTYSSEKINSILSNKNYLVNSEFRFWTYDETSFGINYSEDSSEDRQEGEPISRIEKWLIQNNITVSEDDKITLVKNDTGGFSIECYNAAYTPSGSISLYQFLNDSFFETYAGMDYVLTTKINNTINITQGIVPDISASDEEKNIANIEIPLILIPDSEDLSYKTVVHYAKLELGTVSTSYIPRTYKEECDIWGKKKVLQAGRVYPAIYNAATGYLYVDIPYIDDFAYTIFPEGEYDFTISLNFFTAEDYPILQIYNWTTSNGQLLIYINDVNANTINKFVEVRFSEDWYVNVDNVPY